jgi:hypothetical protein
MKGTQMLAARDGRVRRRIFIAAEPTICFVRLDCGLFIKTHACVAYVACPRKVGCGARVGEPCRGKFKGPQSDTHYMRRRAFQKKIQESRR